MASRRSVLKVFATVSFLLACAALATALAPGGPLLARADDPAPPRLLSPSLSSQDDAHNYALYDSEEGSLTFYYGQVPATDQFETIYEGYDTQTYASANDRPWGQVASKIKSVTFDPSVEGHLQPVSTAYWFSYLYDNESINGLEYLDTSQVTTMERMFAYALNGRGTASTLDVSVLNTGNVTNMRGLFYGFYHVTGITFGGSFTTAKVTDMREMFQTCSGLTALDLSTFDTSKVTSMANMFDGCTGLTSLDLSSFDTSNVTDMSAMFFTCSNLSSIVMDESFDTGRVTTMASMFVGCRSLSTIAFPNSFSTTSVTRMNRMFDTCYGLTTLDLSGFDTSHVTDMYQMFQNCSGLTTLDLSQLSTASATNLGYLLYGCSNLQSIQFGEGFSAGAATSVSAAFGNCRSLATLDLSHWTTSAVTDASLLFMGCSSLTSVTMPNMSTQTATRLDRMFDGCGALSQVTLGEGFRFRGASIKYDQYCATLPAPPNDGLWRREGDANAYTAAEVQNLTGSSLAGTWKWHNAIAVVLTASEGGTAAAEPANTGNEGETVRLVATPEVGWHFTCWTLTSGDGSGQIASTDSATTTFTFGSKNGAVTATFACDDSTYELLLGELSPTQFTYSGAPQAPSLMVRDSSTLDVLKAGDDYQVTYEKSSIPVANPTEPGEYDVYVEGLRNYAGEGRKRAGSFVIIPSYAVSGTLACESGWNPGSGWYGCWGSLQLQRPTGAGTYVTIGSFPQSEPTFTLEGVTQGMRIVYTPYGGSGCAPVTYDGLGSLSADTNIGTITAPFRTGSVRFESLALIDVDRLYDPVTGTDYTKDDDEDARTTSFSLNAGSTTVRAFRKGTATEVPVTVFDGLGLVIDDDALALGAAYTIELGVRPPVFSGGYFRSGSDYRAVTHTLDVTMTDLGGGLVGAQGIEVRAYAQGRADIHYANPSATSASVFLFDGSGAYVGDASIATKGEGVIPTRHLDAGSYTVAVVDRDVFAQLSNAGAGGTKAPSTLSEIRGLGFGVGQLVERTFTVANNKLVDVGIVDPITFPARQEADVVDRARSSVTATSSYSSYATITTVVSLADGADTDALNHDDWWWYRPKLRIYTNQKQTIVDGSGVRASWPQSLSINGQPVEVLDKAASMDFAMRDGWLDLDLFELCPTYEGAASFPLTVSLTVPRSDYGRITASAYLVLPSRSNFVGTFDQATDDLSLVAPEVTAETSFTAHGYTSPGADVTLELDGVAAATATADEYGYYSTLVQLPDDCENSTVFGLQTVATWSVESQTHTARSSELTVTYSTTRPSLKRLWMLTQHGRQGAWDYVLAYEDGEWSSMYKGYFLGGSWANRRFMWLAELNNAEYATNVECVVPMNGGDIRMPCTRDLEQADTWLSLSNPGAGWYANPGTLSAQSLAEDEGLIELGQRGTLDYNKAAQLVREHLLAGNSYVSEPVHLTIAPSGAYVTFDEIERQSLGAADAYAGPSGQSKQDVAAFVSALNQNSDHMVLVNQELGDDNGLVKVDPDAAAAAYVASDPGQVDEWIAVAFGLDPDGAPLADPKWLQLHHTVATSEIDDASEPLGMISAAQAKYQEYLQAVRDAQAQGRSVTDAVAYCPCEEPDNATGGVPIRYMSVRADDELDSVRYFVWAEDSNRNTYMRTMERYEVAGGAVAYRQYEADEKRLTISEWNDQTRQKKVITYELADSFVQALTDGQHDTDFALLMSLWSHVGSQVQLGFADAVNAMTSGDGLGPQEDVLMSQAKGGVVDNIVNGMGDGVCWLIESPGNAARSVGKWFEKVSNWRETALKEAGLITDWGQLSNDELKSLYKFIWDNKNSCLHMESKIQQSDPKGAKLGNPYGDAQGAAFRGGIKRVYDVVEFAKGFGQKFYEEGAKAAVKEVAEGYFKNKTEEAYRNFVWGQRPGFEDDVLSKYSDEYKDIVLNLINYQRRIYGNGNPNGYPANCIDWSAIPDELYYALRYREEKPLPKHEQRARSNGSIWPRGKYDPSGMVYEGMLSNPVEGARVVLYTYSATSPNADHAVLVDSSKFGYEENPQVTGADGGYQWFVGEGYWQVRVTKDGYDPVSTGSSGAYGIGATRQPGGEGTPEESTWWMPVLPEQIQVNIPLVSTAAPVIESVQGTSKGLEVTFSKPVKIDTVDPSMFALSGAEVGEGVAPASAQPLDADVAADGSLGADGKPQRLARTFLLAYPDGTTLVPRENPYEASVTLDNGSGALVSYAGTAATGGNATSTFSVTPQLQIGEVGGQQTYDGTPKVPAVAASDANDPSRQLVAGTDYELSYVRDGESVPSPTDAGTYAVFVTGKGDYEDSGTIAAGTFTVTRRSATITAHDQSVLVGQRLSPSPSGASVEGAAAGHSLSSVTLEAPVDKPATVSLTPVAACLRDASGTNVTPNYDLTFQGAVLTVVDHYTVHYNLNGGSGVAGDQATDGEGRVTLRKGDPLSRVGWRFTGWNTAPNGSGTAYAAGSTHTLSADLTLYAQWERNAPAPAPVEVTQGMHRLYNPNSGEHFYTASTHERDVLVGVGWNYEGIGWKAPLTSKSPVYRLYNANAGDHHYTMSKNERDTLVSVGWTYEGVGWYSSDAKAVPLFRQYNPNAVAGSHNYTTSKNENDTLVTLGWRAEGIGWYGV